LPRNSTRRRVALKFPQPRGQAYQERFLGEARSASKLLHPQIAQIFDYGYTLDGQPFLVMELVQGRDLHHILRETPLEIPRAIEITQAVLAALEEEHRSTSCTATSSLRT
jgi:serine/threonine-protein kinase